MRLWCSARLASVAFAPSATRQVIGVDPVEELAEAGLRVVGADNGAGRIGANHALQNRAGRAPASSFCVGMAAGDTHAILGTGALDGPSVRPASEIYIRIPIGFRFAERACGVCERSYIRA